jgi:hypothetical protein
MTAISILEETRQKFNKICLVHQHQLGRCIGYHEDAYDCYYFIRLRDGKEYYASAVGYCEPLDSIPGYEGLESNFTRWGCPPAESFSITKASDAENELIYGRDEEAE